MNPQEITAGLTDDQADGLACVICGLDYLRAPGSASIPVDRAATGSQVFACIGRCAEAAEADPTTMGRYAGGGCR